MGEDNQAETRILAEFNRIRGVLQALGWRVVQEERQELRLRIQAEIPLDQLRRLRT